MKVIWSDDADSTFADVIESIEKRFSRKVAIEFMESTFNVIEVIESYPKLYTKVNVKGIKGVHQAVIHPKTSMFYSVGKTHIEILFFWFNRAHLETE